MAIKNTDAKPKFFAPKNAVLVCPVCAQSIEYPLGAKVSCTNCNVLMQEKSKGIITK